MEIKIPGHPNARVIRTDLELIFKFFINPYWWFRFKIIYEPNREYGIVVGPILIAIVIIHAVDFGEFDPNDPNLPKPENT